MKRNKKIEYSGDPIFNLQVRLGLIFFCIVAMACNRPVAKFTYLQNDSKAPSVVRFENESTKAAFYEWSFGDGKTSVHKSPEHKFYRSGEYDVRLKAISDKNKISEFSKKITVEKPEKTMVEIQTSYGNMIAELYDDTPEHRDNFKKLTVEGFYDSLLFHRVINGFMIQGGDPESKSAAQGQPLGSGGPGYTIPAEIKPELVHLKGSLAAARTGDAVNPEKRSSGSQFYIVQGTSLEDKDLDMIEIRTGTKYTAEQREAYKRHGGVPFLDNQYTVFGRVVDGLEVIDKIAQAKTDQRDRPVEDIQMTIKLID